MISKNTLLAFILIALITTLVYASSLKNSFVWDDYIAVVNSDFVKSWNHFPALFSKSYLTPYVKIGCCYFPDGTKGSGETSYRPVVTVSYFIDYFLWKLKPYGYHLHNLLLHILNAILLFVFIDIAFKTKKVALLAALFFALHPINSEAVNVISFREELLAGAFLLFSLISYIKLDAFHGSNKILCYAFSLVSFSLALFSKEMSLTFPALLFLYDYYFAIRENAKGLQGFFKPRHLGYMVVLVFYILVRFVVLVNASEPPAEFPGGSMYSNILTMLKVFAMYIEWALWPVGIHATLPGDAGLISYSFSDPKVLLSMVVLILCIAAAIKIRKTSKVLSFAILWFFVTLLPVANLIPLSIYMASRYLYIPSMGFCFLAADFLVKLNTWKVFSVSPNFLKRCALDATAVLLIFYSIFTMMRGYVWKNDTRLWLELVERYPHNGLAHSSLGNCFKKSGFMDKAIGEYRKAIALNPELIEAYTQLGIILAERGDYDGAVAYFRQAIKAEPTYVKAYDGLAVTYTRLSQWHAARSLWERALEINPQFEAARSNLKKLEALGN